MKQLQDIQVLNVDDDPTTRFLVSGFVRQAGGNCVVAANGDECMAQLEAKPDLQVVVLDYQLSSTETGSMIAARIREVRNTIPIILLTGEKNGQQIAESDKNFNGYLKKPILPTEVIFAIRKALHKNTIL